MHCKWDQTSMLNFKALNQRGCFLRQYFPQQVHENSYAFTKKAAWGNFDRKPVIELTSEYFHVVLKTAATFFSALKNN